MKNFKRLISLVLRAFYTFKKVGVFSLNNNEADYIVWAPDFFSLRFLYGDNLQKVLFTYYHLSVSGKSVTVWARNDVGRFHNRSIIYFGAHYYNCYDFRNYMDSMVYITRNLEAQGNKVFPNSNEVSLWENKAYMHQRFHELKIKTPLTRIYSLEDSLSSSIEFGLSFPLLLKEEHSCSSLGLYKVNSIGDLEAITARPELGLRNKNLILQNLIDIRRDLRVIFIGEEIVLHYWRINTSSEWKPTSTGHGSLVDFDYFPEEWRCYLQESFAKLGIRTGAFDVAWDKDDLSSEPYILEVSPFYQPNPRPTNLSDLKSYGEWKRSVRTKNSYQEALVFVIYDIQAKFVKTILST